MKTIQEFINKHGITLKSVHIQSRPDEIDPDWQADHWDCTLRMGRTKRTMQLFYSKGAGLNGARPDVDEVLDCLAYDADGLDMCFEEWAKNFGYNPDSRKAESIYRSCKESSRKLVDFLGSQKLQELLEDTERL